MYHHDDRLRTTYYFSARDIISAGPGTDKRQPEQLRFRTC